MTNQPYKKPFMSKSAKVMTVLVIVLLVLVSVLHMVKSFNKLQSEALPEEANITILDIAKEDIIKLTYEYEGETLVFEKTDDVWYYAPDHSLTIAQYMISNILGELAPLQAIQVVEDVDNMAMYGIVDESRVVTFETAEETYSFAIGVYNETTNVSYIAMPGEDDVYVVEGTTVTVFDKSLEDVVETTGEATAE